MYAIAKNNKSQHKKQVEELKIKHMAYTATCMWAVATGYGNRFCDKEGKAIFPIWDEFINPPKQEEKAKERQVTKEDMQQMFRSLKEDGVEDGALFIQR